MPSGPTHTTSNELSMHDDSRTDQPFSAVTFANGDAMRATRAGASDEDDEAEDMPSNLAISRSQIPGLTPQELLAAHRKSIAEITHRPEGAVDFHSLTLSRHQVVPDVPPQSPLSAVSVEEFRDALKSFTFGDPDGGEKVDGISLPS